MNKDEFLSEYAVERRNTCCVKWDDLKESFGEDGLLPFWIADTEFKIPKQAQKALEERVKHGVFGYSLTPKEYYEAYMNWQKKRYGTELHQDWIRFGSGVVQSISTFVQILTQPGDSVMILQPVYNPFAEVVKNTGRRLVVSELKNANEVYSLDLADMERKIDEENVKLLIFCSPHNPVGRVWSAEELEEMLELCRNKQVRVIFDEIHHDLIVGKKPFVSGLSIRDGYYRDNLVVLDSTSKTFNMAAFDNSHVIVPNPQIMRKYDRFVEMQKTPNGNLLGKVAGEAAYRNGEEWLDGLLEVVRSNYAYVKEQLRSAFPEIICSELEGTYLMWINLEPVVSSADVEDVIKRDAKLAVDFGDWFGKGGAGHIRFNLATTPENVKKATEAMISAIRRYKQQ